MLRQIVVPLDGSPFAEVALPIAVRLAGAAGARLTLVAVHEPARALVPAAGLPSSVGPQDLDLREAEEAYLSALSTGPGLVGDNPAAIELLDGQAGPALAEWMARKGPDLVVMATHGRGPFSRFWLGSVTDYMLRRSPVPLLVVRPADGDQTVRPPALAHGLVALDRSGEALEALAPAADFAAATGAKLTLLTVVEPIVGVEAAAPYPVPVPEDVLESLREEARGYLEDAAAKLRARGIEVTTRIVVRLGVAATLLEELDEGGADFMVMTTHGAQGLQRIVLGSVADKVIRGATKPVLVVRSEG